ncbi:LysE family transporter [Anaerolineales bacterium HSG25]|nr:LysE family transporter [Anaerolineales bacterium HSG25]
MFSYLLQGMILGFSASVTPGPFLAFLLSQTLQNGWRRTLPATFAPLISDGPIIFLVMVVLTQTPDNFLNIIQILGGFFLLYLAKGAWQAAQQEIQLTESVTDSIPRTMLKGAMMNALSPGPYIFWSILAGPIVLEGWRQSPALGLSFVVGFYVTIIAGFMGFVFLVAATSQVNPNLNKRLSQVAAVALLLFGLVQISTGLMVLY